MEKLSDWSYVEVAHYVSKIKAVIREKRDGESVMLSLGDETERFRERHHNTGVYTSVFRYAEPTLEARRISPLYFDLDAEEDLPTSHREARLLYQHLATYVPEDVIKVYFTGAKGFHIEISPTTLGLSPSMELTKIFRLIADHLAERLQLETIDFGVYEPRRMWRMPDSKNQKTGLYKVRLLEEELLSPLDTILAVAESPRRMQDDMPPRFDPRANEWFKSWIVKLDEINEQREIENARRKIEMFNKYGTSVLKGPSKKYVKAVWKSALEALESAEPNKDRNNTLSRQAYRLYITLLEAHMDLDAVTERLYNIGIGMGLEEREVRATLRSAEQAAQRKHEEE